MKQLSKYKLFLFLCVLLLQSTTIVFAQHKSTDTLNNFVFAKIDSVNRFYSDIRVKHLAYNLSFNRYYKLANWVAYELTSDKIDKKTERTNNFMTNPKLIATTATDADYFKSGFDRGHLVPAGDMVWSEEAMFESFYYSNVAPQYPKFNRGIWKKLETQVRNWALDYKKIMVFTGPILDTMLSNIGVNQIPVPLYFYKVIIDNNNSKGIAFLMPNQASDLAIENYALSIDSLELLMNINFLPQLDSVQEIKIESRLCYECWGLNLNLKNQNSVSLNPKTQDTLYQKQLNQITPTQKNKLQCAAITKAGTRCKRNAIPKSKKCQQHQSTN